MHRLYVHADSASCYFAAEAKAILAVRADLRRASSRGLGEMVACGCILEDRTVFENIQALPPASAWVFRKGGAVAKGKYFKPQEWEEQEHLEPEQFYLQLREVFARDLPKSFEGPHRVGMSLTGGLDTRMIMAWQRSAPGSMPCYSFGGTYRDCQDVMLARKVADACGQPHQVITVGPEFLRDFVAYAERSVYLTDGCAGVVHAPDLYLNERVRLIAPVRITGNYGGEVLRRVRAFKPVQPRDGLYSEDMMAHVRHAETVYAESVKVHPLTFAMFRQCPWHHYGLLSLEQTQVEVRSPFLSNEFVRTVYRAPESSCRNSVVSLRLVEDGNAALSRIRTDRGLAGDRGPLPAAAERFLLNFMAKAEYAYNDGMPQWLARANWVLAPFRIERYFLGWHKFTHFRVWYRDALSGCVRDILLDPRSLSRPYLERRSVEQMVKRHLDGTGNYTHEISQLLTMELLHRVFLD